MAPKLVIADADPDLCDLYRLFFSNQGWHVRTCGGGLECLARLQEAAPDLLVLDRDLHWGGADGVLALMRNVPELAQMPVILTSAEPFIEAPAPPAAPVLLTLWKPFSLSVLLDVACAWMRTRPSAPSRGRGELDPVGVRSRRKGGRRRRRLLRGPLDEHSGRVPRGEPARSTWLRRLPTARRGPRRGLRVGRGRLGVSRGGRPVKDPAFPSVELPATLAPGPRAARGRKSSRRAPTFRG